VGAVKDVERRRIGRRRGKGWELGGREKKGKWEGEGGSTTSD